MMKLPLLLCWGTILLTTCAAIRQPHTPSKVTSTVIEQSVRQSNVQLLENEVQNLNAKFRLLQSINQKIGLFNVSALKNKVMDRDIQKIEQETSKRKDELQKQNLELTLLQSELDSLRQNAAKSAVDAQIEKINSFSLYCNNLQNQYDEELRVMTTELDNRFGTILELSLRMFLEQNTSYILLVTRESVFVPVNNTKWPLEIVDIQKALMTLGLRNYYGSSDAQTK